MNLNLSALSLLPGVLLFPSTKREGSLREALGDDAVGVEGPSGSGGGAGWKLVIFFLFLGIYETFPRTNKSAF